MMQLAFKKKNTDQAKINILFMQIKWYIAGKISIEHVTILFLKVLLTWNFHQMSVIQVIHTYKENETNKFRY